MKIQIIIWREQGFVSNKLVDGEFETVLEAEGGLRSLVEKAEKIEAILEDKTN